MKQTKRNTFNVLFFIKRTKLLKNGEAPIGMRITINGQSIEIMLKRSVKASEWNQTKERTKASTHSGRELNDHLEATRAKIWQIERDMEAAGDVINPKTVKDRFLGTDNKRVHRTLIEVYQEHNDKCKALIGVDYTASTVEKFGTSLKCIKEYLLHQYSREDMYLKEIDSNFVTNFEFYIKTVRKCQHNSALKHLKNLRKIILIAISNEWISRDPFANIKLKRVETHPVFLSQDELSRIINKKFTIRRLEVVKDIFLFGVYTGMAYIDMQQLRPEHIIRDNSGAMWIRKPRQKTGTMCNIPLISPAAAIIAKYAEDEDVQSRGAILPKISNQKLNSYLKEIADVCSITKSLSSHCARHTAATITFCRMV